MTTKVFFSAYYRSPYECPIDKCYQSQKKSGWLAKWVMELGKHELIFKSRTSIKAHALVDFIIEIIGHMEVSMVMETKTNDKDT